MSRSKRNYWLKLKEDFFQDDVISWIEEQDKGVYYINFYLKLCLKTINSEGILVRKVGDMLIPYDTKALSKITGTDVDTIIVAMELFKKTGLVEVLENGEIYLNQVKNMIGSETGWAEKKRLQRANKNANKDIKGDNVPALLGQCPIDIDKDKDKDIDKDINNIYNQIRDKFNSTCKEMNSITRMTDKRKSHIKQRLQEFSLEEIFKVIEIASKSDFLNGHNNKNWKANFDWIINPNNFVKILEGNYNNKNSKIEQDQRPRYDKNGFEIEY